MSKILLGVYLYIVYYGPLYGVFERLLGERLHEKLIRAPMTGYWPQIANPRSFNECVMHRKLYTNRDLYSKVSDKWAVREYVRTKLEEEEGILNELYHVTDDPETIPFETFPDKYVIKATHGSAMNIIIENQQEVDIDDIKAQCQSWLDRSFGERQREYWYGNITPRIIVEKYIESANGEVPEDYKLFVFNGKVEYIEVDFDRHTNHKRRFFDGDWNPQDFKLRCPLGPVIDEPEMLDRMVQVAETLGEDFDFARVDLYQPSPDEVVFGEITLAHGSGGEQFVPKRYDFDLGSLVPS